VESQRREPRPPLFGIETEYGISVSGHDAEDLMAESRALVSAYPKPFASPWNYRVEDPRKDMRGFRVDHLNRDPIDAQFDDPKSKPLPAEVERADRVLVNGARFYNDHAHPEYCTPECTGIIDLVAHDRAGEEIVLDCAKRRAEAGLAVSIYKNNTDFHGSSYGCHENYLLSRESQYGLVVAHLTPFLITRQVYAGAGKVGVEPSGNEKTIYQLSQRSDFFTEEASVDTLHRRPIINTRDEPHADPRKWRRVHVICGDANCSEYATALKVGTTSLVIGLIEMGAAPKFALDGAVRAIKEISRDQTWKWILKLQGGKTISAIDVQREYLNAACEIYAGFSADADWTLREWGATLTALERNPRDLANKLDWVAKRVLIDEYLDSEGMQWDEAHLQSIDLAYTNIDHEEGFRDALESAGQLVRLSNPEDVERAKGIAPTNTRAILRGELIRKFRESIGTISWSGVVFRTEEASWLADLSDYLSPESIKDPLAAIERAESLDDLMHGMR
jgi:proteasome accessory factor A